MAELDEFRAEVRAWLDENAPKSLVGLRLEPTEGAWGGRRPNWTHPDQALWLERAADRGFTAPTWPTAYGGGYFDFFSDEKVSTILRMLRQSHFNFHCQQNI